MHHRVTSARNHLKDVYRIVIVKMKLSVSCVSTNLISLFETIVTFSG